MVHFVGAGPGAADLITVRGRRLLEEADVVIYAGSLVNPELLQFCKENCDIYNSAKMTLEEVVNVMRAAEQAGKNIVRLHTGDPCLYGAVREQMDELEKAGIAYEVCPGVSSFCGAAASLGLEYTLPGISQSVVITRMTGRTEVPVRESMESWAFHGATMVIFLSASLLRQMQEKLLLGGYREETPAAIVYKATWPDEKIFRCTVSTLAETAEKNGITKTALIIVGEVVNCGSAAADSVQNGNGYSRSKLYDPSFSTEFRKGTKFGSLQNSS